MLRSITHRTAALDEEIAAFDQELDTLVAAAPPTTRSQFGVGNHHTATLLVAGGENFERFTSETASSHLCAAAPVEGSSG